jgi:hypothetical protein
MKTKLVPLVLLIPAVVLAQPTPMPAPQAGMPPSNTMSGQPANPAKAAAALSTAKQLSSTMKGNLSSDGEMDCRKGSYVATSSGASYCTKLS